MTPRRALATAALLLALPVFSACGEDDDTSGSAPQDLAGNVFVGSDVTGHDIVPGSSIRLEFDRDKLSAYAGCNRMSGGYSLDADTLVVEQLAATMMGCADDLMNQDTWLSGFLQGSPTVARDGDTLTLTSGDTVVRLDEESSVRATLPLEGTDWTLTTVIQNEAASSVPADTTAGLRIDGGSLLARTGCNNGRATVTVSEDALTVSPVMTTKMACPPPYDQIEPAFLAVLQSNPTYQIDYDTLKLTSPDGASGLVFTGVAPADPTPTETEAAGAPS